MPKFLVILDATVDVEVLAEDIQEAKAKARKQAGDYPEVRLQYP